MLSTCTLFFNQVSSSSNKPELKLSSPNSHELKPSNPNKPELKLISPNLYELNYKPRSSNSIVQTCTSSITNQVVQTCTSSNLATQTSLSSNSVVQTCATSNPASQTSLFIITPQMVLKNSKYILIHSIVSKTLTV